MFATRTAHILVVEDHDFMRRSYKTFFQLEDDIEVEWMVETGGEAQEVLRDNRPDLAVVDMDLPDMDGSDVIRTCREADPPIPALVVSGHNQTEVINRALEAGAQGYVIKGNAQHIVEGVKAVLRGERFLSDNLPDDIIDSDPW
jgi:DNA-binding NarL/FixJ family response regulator